MSKDVVWASAAMVNPANLRPITHCFSGDDASLDFAINSKRANENGEALGPECFPPDIFVAKRASTNYDKLPDFFFAGSYWVVSGAAGRIMQQFNLGNGNLYPTQVFKKDRKTPIGDDWYCLNFGNVKKAYRGGGRSHRSH
jgi:hypothetical protein